MPGDHRLAVATSDMVQWTRAFVRHPSPQTERFEHEPQVQSFIGATVIPLLRQLSLPSRRDEMGNVLIELGPERADPSLMLIAYAMTHPANRMRNPFDGELIEDPMGIHIRGRGVSEQKGSLAAALAAVKTAADRLSLRGRLVFAVSTAGETGRHDAAISIRRALGYCPQLVVIAIGTNGRVALANKGRIDVAVTVRGKSAHSSMPLDGRRCHRGRAPRARSGAVHRCQVAQARSARRGLSGSHCDPIMAGRNPHGAGRSSSHVRSAPAAR
jgi:acetylornithine deacetylase/succinyl-diaminopimelate desuccinylase-like protein